MKLIIKDDPRPVKSCTFNRINILFNEVNHYLTPTKSSVPLPYLAHSYPIRKFLRVLNGDETDWAVRVLVQNQRC